MSTPKWREPLIDPHTISFNNDLLLEEIIGYPHAWNDVFECHGKKDGENIDFYLKIQRDEKGNIKNEALILPLIKNYNLPIPELLDVGKKGDFYYIVISSLNGQRLSTILEGFEDKKKESIKYMKSLGKMLSYIHSLEVSSPKAKLRKINNIPIVDDLSKYPEIKPILEWLNSNMPAFKYNTFIHGDFHYANVLWSEYQISGVLDWEYSGQGLKEQDIAWSLILRPSQKFMDSKQEVDLFLEGYRETGFYDEKKLRWCLINGYVHFYIMNIAKNDEYCNKIIKIIYEILCYNFNG